MLYLTVSDTETPLDLKNLGSYLTTNGVDTDSAVLDADEEDFVAWTVVAKREDAEGEDNEDADGEIPTNLPSGAFDENLLRGDALEDLWFVLTYTLVQASPGGTP